MQRNFLESFGELYKVASEAVPNISKGGLLGLAEDLWLDLLGQSHFGIARAEATNAVHVVTLTANVASPGGSWSAGSLVVSTPAPDAQYFESVEPGSIAAGETKSVSVRARIPGAKGSVGNDTITVMTTPISGVTVTNPADPDTGHSMTTVGVDKETNPRYSRRCELRWASLTYSSPRDAYELWVLEADATVNRVTVRAPKGDGTVNVVAATPSGGITALQESAILAYIQNGRRPINDIPSVESALPVPVNVTCKPTVKRGVYATPTAAANALKAAWDLYLSNVPIGGDIVAPSSVGQVIRDRLIDIAMTLPGFRRVSINSPTSDIALSSNEVPTGSYNITILEES
jgi:uncharacterized phage protein gp47/JayE